YNSDASSHFTSSAPTVDSVVRHECRSVRLELLSDGSEFLVQARGDALLQVLRVEFADRVRLRELVERLVDDVAAELRIPGDHQFPAVREVDEPRNLEDRIADRHLCRAARLPVRSLHVA